MVAGRSRTPLPSIATVILQILGAWLRRLRHNQTCGAQRLTVPARTNRCSGSAARRLQRCRAGAAAQRVRASARQTAELRRSAAEVRMADEALLRRITANWRINTRSVLRVLASPDEQRSYQAAVPF